MKVTAEVVIDDCIGFGDGADILAANDLTVSCTLLGRLGVEAVAEGVVVLKAGFMGAGNLLTPPPVAPEAVSAL